MEEHSDSKELELAEDIVLLLLAADNESEIRGKTLFVKQVFLIAMEIVENISEPLEFYPFQIGPYSTVLAKMLNQMIRDSLIDADTDGNQWVFRIANKGRSIVESVKDKIAPETMAKIESMKRTTSDWGTNNVLRYVYVNYPEYAIDSRIREVIVNS